MRAVGGPRPDPSPRNVSRSRVARRSRTGTAMALSGARPPLPPRIRNRVRAGIRQHPPPHEAGLARLAPQALGRKGPRGTARDRARRDAQKSRASSVWFGDILRPRGGVAGCRCALPPSGLTRYDRGHRGHWLGPARACSGSEVVLPPRVPSQSAAGFSADSRCSLPHEVASKSS